MGNYKNSCVFNFAILLKSQNFDAREIYVFYNIAFNWQPID